VRAGPLVLRSLIVALVLGVSAAPASADALRPADGKLSFRVGGHWYHPTRLISTHGLTRTYATNAPGGRRLRVRISGGALDATASGAIAMRIAFPAHPGERYLGFGERSNAVNQRGHQVEDYVAEGPYEKDERAVIPSFVPAWGFHPRDDATYYPMPWLLSTRGYGVLVDSAETSLWRLRGRKSWSVDVAAARLRLRVFGGPRPADALRRMSAAIGRQPAPPAPYVFGPWYQPTGDDEQAVLADMQRRDVPLSLAQTYTHYLPCEAQLGTDERSRAAFFHAAGLAITTYFNPMICTTHTRFGAAGTLLRTPAGAPYVFPYRTSQTFDVAEFDFTSAAGRGLYGRLLDEALADGHDGWMEDFGEYTPLDARAAKGPRGSALHNLYPTQYHCAAFAATPKAVRFIRSGWIGTARCAPVVWGGDPSVDWGFDGLRSVVTNGLTMGLSGVSRWGSDIGGYFALFENKLTPELLTRWIEVGAVSGVMRTQASGIRIPESVRPQIWDANMVGLWRRWAKLRTQLYPYLAAADAAYRRTGLPLMRHLVLAYPRDRRAARQDDEFLFGPDLLAAPVLDKGARRRSLYLPRGRWVDLWRSARYRSGDGGLSLERARVLRGGRSVKLPAPLDELPLLARAGTLLPLLAPDVDTLAAYGDRAPAVSLNERRGERVLLAWPSGRSSAALEDGGSLASREGSRSWTLTIRGKRRREWTISASLATLEHPFRPCTARATGGKLERWSYDRKTRVLHATFRARHASLVARGC
jgi:alpha-glucosidase (family GH31 glycosyl hydrolase)